MGKYLLDQYTYLHFATGIIAYFWGLPLKTSIIVHTIFEILENTTMGIFIINNYIPVWPGQKLKSDTHINILGDTIGFIMGWISAYYLDKLGTKLNWYSAHIKN